MDDGPARSASAGSKSAPTSPGPSSPSRHAADAPKPARASSAPHPPAGHFATQVLVWSLPLEDEGQPEEEEEEGEPRRPLFSASKSLGEPVEVYKPIVGPVSPRSKRRAGKRRNSLASAVSGSSMRRHNKVATSPSGSPSGGSPGSPRLGGATLKPRKRSWVRKFLSGKSSKAAKDPIICGPSFSVRPSQDALGSLADLCQQLREHGPAFLGCSEAATTALVDCLERMRYRMVSDVDILDLTLVSDSVLAPFHSSWKEAWPSFFAGWPTCPT